MKQIILLFTAIAILSSCKRDNTAHVKPETTTVNGDLTGYLEVIDGDYQITEDWGGNLSIKVKALKPLDDGMFTNKYITLAASLLDDKGSPVSGTGDFELDFKSRDKFISLLKRGDGEEIVILSSGLGNYHAEQHAHLAKKFIVSGTITDETVSSSNNSSSSDESSSDTESEIDGNASYDEMLDAYEKYTDDYIKVINSMNNDDMSGAMSNYADLLSSSQDLEQKLKAVENKLTTKQASRLLKIQSKMIKAMEKMNSFQ